MSREITASLIKTGSNVSNNMPRLQNEIEIYINGGLVNIGPVVQNPIFWITTEPAMPEIKIINKSLSTIPVSLTIEYNMQKTFIGNSYNRLFKDNYPKKLPVIDNVEQILSTEEWEVDFGGEIRGGKVTINYISRARILEKKESFVYYIRGKNPSESDILNYIKGKNYTAKYPKLIDIIKKESKGKHFNEGTPTSENQIINLPNYRSPQRIGLMTQEGNKSDQLIWNWKANIDQGILDLDKRIDPKKLKFSKKGENFVKGYESTKKKNGKHILYDDDLGYCTIGYGHLVDGKKSCKSISNISTAFKNGLTDEEANKLFSSDANKMVAVVQKKVTVNLSQNEFDALVSFVFNFGPGNFGTSTLLAKLNDRKYDEVPSEFLKWNKGGDPKRELRGLTLRREAEVNIFKNNIYDSTH